MALVGIDENPLLGPGNQRREMPQVGASPRAQIEKVGQRAVAQQL
jgi:hypothetical protein